MSITVPHPLKRHFDEGEELFSTEDLQTDYNNPHKRFRNQASPSGRCGSGRLASYPSYTIGSSTFTAVRALFPRMSDKVIADVLAEYGDNVDAAIRHLNDLQLSLPAEAVEQPQEGSTSPINEVVSLASGAPAVDGAAAAPEAKTAPTRTAEQWVDLMVEQMSAASSLDDAKTRASEVLKGFEQAVMQHADSQEGRTGELARENALLKRAVAIQNARLQELGSKETEVGQLKAALDAARSRVHYLEVQNYSLQLHLKQAADARDDSFTMVGGHKNPDVF